MAPRKRTKQTMPLIIEEHPDNYSGYPFITLLQFRQQHILTIVDNTDDKLVKAFVLDQCGPERVSEELLINTAENWFNDGLNDVRPLSIEAARVGLTNQLSGVYRTFNVEFISRVIGPFPSFPMNEVISVKRRRRKPITAGVRINNVARR